MELLDVKGYTQSFVETVENDDLDLQLVALHCVEQYGGVVTTQRLSDEWLSHVHFQYDEYGHALTNMRKGLRAPLSSKYNNYFTDCMGSPIRSELWGILCAGIPDMAAYYAFQDACVDHAGGEGVYGEIFFAVFESLAFVNDDIPWLIDKSLSYLPAESATAGAVQCLLKSHSDGLDWKAARQVLIDHYGGENFTYAPINIAFTLMGLLYGEGFTERLLISTNCGYDSDCTCATIASMMGILYGSAYIDEMWTKPLGETIIVSPPVNGFDAPKTIEELTERSLQAHRVVTALYETAKDKRIYRIDTELDKELGYIPVASFFDWEYRCETIYQDNHPAIAPGEEKEIVLRIISGLTIPSTLRVTAHMENKVEAEANTMELAAGKSVEYRARFTAKGDKSPSYPGYFLLERMENGSVWSSHQVPFVLLPSQDWILSVDSDDGQAVFSKDSRIPVEQLNLDGARQLRARSKLYLPVGKRVRLIATCRQPLSITVDGKLLADCKEETAEIPAYHRSDPKKCADIALEKGFHDVEILVSDASELKNLFFYVVDPAFNCAAELGITLQAK